MHWLRSGSAIPGAATGCQRFRGRWFPLRRHCRANSVAKHRPDRPLLSKYHSSPGARSAAAASIIATDQVIELAGTGGRHESPRARRRTTSRARASGSSGGRRGTQHRPDLDVFIGARLAPFAPVATLLVPPERRVETESVVDRSPTGSQPAGYCPSLLDVGGGDISGKTIFRVVGNPDRLVDVVVADDRKHGPEDLLARN